MGGMAAAVAGAVKLTGVYEFCASSMVLTLWLHILIYMSHNTSRSLSSLSVFVFHEWRHGKLAPGTVKVTVHGRTPPRYGGCGCWHTAPCANTPGHSEVLVNVFCC